MKEKFFEKIFKKMRGPRFEGGLRCAESRMGRCMGSKHRWVVISGCLLGFIFIVCFSVIALVLGGVFDLGERGSEPKVVYDESYDESREFGYNSLFYEDEEAKFLQNAQRIKVFCVGDEDSSAVGAKNILYGYLRNQILKDIGASSANVVEFVRQIKDYKEHNIWAVFYDLNEDGNDEIIGYNWGFCGTVSCHLYILEKGKNGYADISNSDTSPYEYVLAVLEGTAGGYHYISTKSGGVNSSIDYILKYK